MAATAFPHCLRSSPSPVIRWTPAGAGGSARPEFARRLELRANSALSCQSQSDIGAGNGGHHGRRTWTPRLARRGIAQLRKESRKIVTHATLKEEQEQVPAVQTSTTLKGVLEDLKAVGRVRLIVNTGVAVLESVTSFENVYYHAGPRGEYANVMSREDNVDFHLLLHKVTSARLVRGKSTRGGVPTCMVRFVDETDSVAVSVLVMWKLGTDGEYDPGQVEAFEALAEKYGEEVKFCS